MVNKVRGEQALDLTRWLACFEQKLHYARAVAIHQGYAAICSFTQTVQLDAESLEQALQRFSSTTCWYWRGGDIVRLGIDVCSEVRSGGEARFHDIERAWRNLRAALICDEDDFPRWFAGFSFSDDQLPGPWSKWPNALLVLPQFLFEQDEKGGRVTVCAVVDPSADVHELQDKLALRLAKVMDVLTDYDEARSTAEYRPDAEHAGSATPLTSGGLRTESNDSSSQALSRTQWERQVLASVSEIRDGQYKKVVLARQCVAQANESVSDTVRRLWSMYPESVVYAICWQHEWFIGASPEQLAGVHKGQVLVDCLAGTTRRGDNAREDLQLQEELLHSNKDRHEHAVVVDFIKTEMSPLLTELDVQAEPSIRKLANVQHLYTPLRGRLKCGGSVLTLAAALHPTPAVAGVPRQRAIQVIQERELMHRGWYSGPIGWLDTNGDGQFIVALRCALVADGTARLFAGAGIVKDSDPAKEWVETEWKMQPMRVALSYGEAIGDARK